MPVPDYLEARQRMRRLRAAQGGTTVHDRARAYALRQLQLQYPGAFAFHRDVYLIKHQKEVTKAS
jgi:hypothetical protein